MSKENDLYLEIGHSIPDAEESQLFGKPCFKIHGKAFICFFENCMVFTLKGDAHAEALALKGAVLFDPSGKKRPMKEWVQLPGTSSVHWKNLAQSAFHYVTTATK